MPFQARRNVSLDKRFILSLRLNPGIVVKLNIPEKKCGETVQRAMSPPIWSFFPAPAWPPVAGLLRNSFSDGARPKPLATIRRQALFHTLPCSKFRIIVLSYRHNQCRDHPDIAFFLSAIQP